VTIDELRPSWRDFGKVLMFDCPCGPPRCGSKIRVPPGWTVLGELPRVTVHPSIWIVGHVHFNVTAGAIVFSPA
jgi:hypothetical protein